MSYNPPGDELTESLDCHEESKKHAQEKTHCALQTAYHENPEEFEEEPAELHSEADIEEETMVSS